MQKFFLALMLPCFFQILSGQKKTLFKIVENDKVGYVNEKGEKVITPTYLNGSRFSCGLAAVRDNGYFGFIDETGKYVIKPQFDFASDFVSDIAVVYKDGKPRFIDKNGNYKFSPVYKGLLAIDDHKGIIFTLTDKQGVIDLSSGKLIIDTAFAEIGEFIHGVAIVKEYVATTNKRKNERYALVDTAGNFIVPFGKYQDIRPFTDGYARVEIKDKRNKDGDIDGLIDTKGNLLFKRSYEDNCYIDGDFHDGFARVSLHKYPGPGSKGTTSDLEKEYEGFMNIKGEIVLDDTSYRYVTDFSNGRTFVEEDSKYILLDRDFKRIGNEKFKRVVNNGFKNGYAIVEGKEGYGIIDTTGSYVVKPRFDEIDHVGVINGYFFFLIEDDESDERLYGIGDVHGNIILKPVMKDFDRNGFENDLLRGVIDDKLSLIDKQGVIVWQQSDTLTTLRIMNIDFMNRGYCYAYSAQKQGTIVKSGGWAVSNNRPKKLDPIKFPDGELYLIIDTMRIDTFNLSYRGLKLYLINSTADTISFSAQDSRLYLKLQAQNKSGEWKDIEYLPSSWCGNSYHQVSLPGKSFWDFTIPDYHGEIKTKIRAQLRMRDNLKTKQPIYIYSNIIEGSINPGQFWNKRSYYPAGIMDPYFD